MRNPLSAHPPWRQLLVVAVALPAVVTLAVLAFAWPAARIAPRNLPVGIVGTTAASAHLAAGLHAAEPGGFEIHPYIDQESANSAIRHRDVYGAFVTTGRTITVLEASAASPTVAQLLTTIGQQLAGHASERARSGQPAVAVKTVDVVPSSSDDPRGLVPSSSLLPLTICSIIIASVIGLVIGFRPAWRQLVALTTVSALAGLSAYLIAEGFLGALPNEHLASWGALALTILAISSATAGLIALIGTAGFALAAGLMVFVGNPFSGVTSAPQLLPGWVDHLGQWLPPGAGANLLRSTAYFHGNGAAGHVVVLTLWTAFGLGAVVVGHHSSTHFAAHPARTTASAPPDDELRAPSDATDANDDPALLELSPGGEYRAGAHQAG